MSSLPVSFVIYPYLCFSSTFLMIGLFFFDADLYLPLDCFLAGPLSIAFTLTTGTSSLREEPPLLGQNAVVSSLITSSLLSILLSRSSGADSITDKSMLSRVWELGELSLLGVTDLSYVFACGEGSSFWMLIKGLIFSLSLLDSYTFRSSFHFF